MWKKWFLDPLMPLINNHLRKVDVYENASYVFARRFSFLHIVILHNKDTADMHPNNIIIIGNFM